MAAAHLALLESRRAAQKPDDLPIPTARFAGSSKGAPMTRQIVFTTKATKPPATYSQAV